MNNMVEAKNTQNFEEDIKTQNLSCFDIFLKFFIIGLLTAVVSPSSKKCCLPAHYYTDRQHK